MRPVVFVFVLIGVLTVVFGVLDQSLGWFDVFAFLDWVLVGRGGFVELGAHFIFICVYAFLYAIALSVALMGNRSFLDDYSLEGLVSVSLQFLAKIIAFFKQVAGTFFGIWAAPIDFILDILLTILATFGIVVDTELFSFTVALSYIALIGLLALVFYRKSWHNPLTNSQDMSLRGLVQSFPGGIIADEVFERAVIETTINPAIAPLRMPLEALDELVEAVTKDLADYTSGFSAFKDQDIINLKQLQSP